MAASPPITCPSCAKEFKSKADLRGKRIRCPFCSESFIVPMDEPEADDDEIAPSEAEAAKATPAAQDDEPYRKDHHEPGWNSDHAHSSPAICTSSSVAFVQTVRERHARRTVSCLRLARTPTHNPAGANAAGSARSS